MISIQDPEYKNGGKQQHLENGGIPLQNSANALLGFQKQKNNCFHHFEIRHCSGLLRPDSCPKESSLQ